MKINSAFAISAFFCSTALLNACGGDSHGAFNPSDSTVPTAVTNLAGNAGSGAVSLGWETPATGSTPFSYDVTISPDNSNATITRDGTHALIQGLNNDASYTFSVTANNSAGESSATSTLLKPTAADTDLSKFEPLSLTDASGPSGIEGPSVLNVGGTIWMAYSSVNYYQQSGHLVQDVSISLASSSDGGSNYAYLTTIGTPQSAVITATTTNPCGNISCNGRWVYEAPFLVDDSSDPDSTRRFKLFALKYFLYPNASTPGQSTFYTLGAIVMWTAASPASGWSSETTVLSWNATPQELSPANNIGDIDSALANCASLREGAAAVYRDGLDFVFACPLSDGTQNIVMLRSTDHATSFEYVATPLTAADATSFGALYFSAPSLLPAESSAPVLIATPVINRAVDGSSTAINAYSGCVVFPFADEETGSLFRDNGGTPLSILQIGYLEGHLNGACAWDRGATGSGVLLNDYDDSATPPFRILKTTKNL